MALTQSLVEEHSFIIDNSDFVETGDKVFIDGHFYSDKPPVPSILAAIVYWPLHQLGFRLGTEWNFAYYVIILFTIKLLWVLSVLAFKQTLSLLQVGEEKIGLLLAIYAFASIMFTWSSTFNNHSLAASSLAIGFMYYLQAKEHQGLKSLLFSGIFFGLAGAMDIPTSIFFVGFAALILNKWKSIKQTFIFLGAAVFPLSIHLLINYSIGHTLLPLQVVPEFFMYEGSVWGNGVQANSMGYTFRYALISLFGVKGFLWYNPLLFILIPLLVKEALSGGMLKLESRVIALCSVILLGYYFIFTPNYGGWSYSIRWFVPLLPFFFTYSYRMDKLWATKNGNMLITGLVVLSILIASIGLINPWSNPDYHSIPLIANLRQFMQFVR